MLTTQLHPIRAAAKQELTFPALFIKPSTGDIVFAWGKYSGVIIHSRGGRENWPLGDTFGDNGGVGADWDNSEAWTRLTTPITLTFTPSSAGGGTQ